MCGINGFTFPDRAVIESMNRQIKHRGPDDGGIYLDRRISLGNVRLAIIDLSRRGHQPMLDEEKRFVVSFNGEIYNFMELRAQLLRKNYTFLSNTDTEVILNLYREYGEQAFRMLNGMFAISIWDSREGKLVLARDRVGIKPLYYCFDGGRLLFSSEIKALFCHPISKKINRTALDLYMRLMYVPSPLTMYEGIHKLIPGQLMIWKKGKLRKTFFWKLPGSITRGVDKSRTKTELRELLTDSIRRQLVADRPVGVFLSGGIDSTILLALATEINASPMMTFSVGFSSIPQEEKFNADLALASRSARHFASDHHEYRIDPQQALTDFRSLCATLDEPIANPTHIPTYALAREARKEVVVSLGGDGGDELFAGYDRYLEARVLEHYQKIPKAIRKSLVSRMLRLLRGKVSEDFFIHLEAASQAEKYLVFMGQVESQLAKIYPSKQENALATLTALRGFRTALPFHELLPRLDFLHWLPEESLMRTDKMTMQFGLEQRVPFLDNRVIDLAFNIPFSWKVGLRQRKLILRQAFRDLLPAFILEAPKRGFFSPGAKWLRDRSWLAYTRENFSPGSLRESGVFNGEELVDMLDAHVSGKQYNLNLIWAALTFQSWYAENFR